MVKAQLRNILRGIALLSCDRRGSISLEYLVLTSIGVTIFAALGVLGAGMVDGYSQTLQVLYSDSP